jgi:hypothetical protein
MQNIRACGFHVPQLGHATSPGLPSPTGATDALGFVGGRDVWLAAVATAAPAVIAASPSDVRQRPQNRSSGSFAKPHFGHATVAGAAFGVGAGVGGAGVDAVGVAVAEGSGVGVGVGFRSGADAGVCAAGCAAGPSSARRQLPQNESSESFMKPQLGQGIFRGASPSIRRSTIAADEARIPRPSGPTGCPNGRQRDCRTGRR